MLDPRLEWGRPFWAGSFRLNKPLNAFTYTFVNMDKIEKDPEP
jgi:hypothetical protein